MGDTPLLKPAFWNLWSVRVRIDVTAQGGAVWGIMRSILRHHGKSVAITDGIKVIRWMKVMLTNASRGWRNAVCR